MILLRSSEMNTRLLMSQPSQVHFHKKKKKISLLHVQGWSAVNKTVLVHWWGKAHKKNSKLRMKLSMTALCTHETNTIFWKPQNWNFLWSPRAYVEMFAKFSHKGPKWLNKNYHDVHVFVRWKIRSKNYFEESSLEMQCANLSWKLFLEYFSGRENTQFTYM